MKAEKEFFILLKLIESPYDGGGLFKKTKALSKTQLQSYLKIYDTTTFYKLFNKLEAFGCLQINGEEPRGHGQMTTTFIVDKRKLYVLLKENEFYKTAVDFFGNRALLGVLNESP